MKKLLIVLAVAVSIDAHSFEVASIRQCSPGTRENPGLHNGTADFAEAGGKLNARATNIKYLLEWAYKIQAPQHSSGPDWVATECYDLAAVAASEATPDEIKQLTRALLEDRFQLKLHSEKRTLPAIVVSLGKSVPKLFPPRDGDVHAISMEQEKGPDQKVTGFRVKFTRYTLDQLNGVFARLLDRVIVDKTGLQGEFNFTVIITPDDTRPNPMDPTLLLTAMREDLSLKLESKDAEVDFLVIEKIERPSAN